MAKRLFFGLLAVVTLLVLFIIYQRLNPSSNDIFKVPKEETTQPSGAVSQPLSTSPSMPAVGANGIFINVSQPVNNSTVANSVLSVSGKTVANADVFVNELQVKADAQGNFSATVTIQEGANNIYVVASDSLGNSTEKDLVVNLESTQ